MTSPISSLLAGELDRLQFGAVDAYLLMEQAPTGYGGQISRRMLGLKLALALGRRAIFAAADDPPYLQTLEPQNAPAPEADWTAQALFDPGADQTDRFLRFEYGAVQALIDNPGGVEGWAQRRAAKRFGLPASANIDGAALSWMRFAPPVLAELEAAQRRLGVTANSLGVHLRRGDKTVESAYVPARHFNKAIARIHQSWRFDSVFLASDSARAVEEIELPRGVRLIFDQEEQRYNNANHKMLFRNPELARQETFTAAKNFFLLSACGGLVGQDNAHFATLAAALVRDRNPEPERVALLHGQIAELESPMLRRYFALKRQARALARACVPEQLRMKLLKLKLF